MIKNAKEPQKASVGKTLNKPPSDEGGAPKGRRERKLPLSHAVGVTAGGELPAGQEKPPWGAPDKGSLGCYCI